MKKSDHKFTLLKKIQKDEALIGIIGLGYVGLPLALAFTGNNFKVLGFDIDAKKIKALEKGDCYISHIDGDKVKQAVKSKKLSATSDFSRLNEPDVIIICVPTPLTAQRDPDMSYIIKTAGQVKNCLRPGQLIVLESTTYPGTTDELVKNMLEETGLICSRDFFLAFSPEREDPGNKSFSTTTIPKVVGGVDKASGDLAQAMYEKVIQKTVRVKNSRTAEAVKLTENIFRAINIAMVNELKVIYERMGIDIWDVLDAAATKPFGFMRFNPGPGWGGHCIPLDPFYLSWKARECGMETKFIELAGEVNRRMPEYTVSRLQQALNERGKSVKGSKIMVIGLAYKKDINDDRESPAYKIISLLIEMGANISYHDPYVPIMKHTRQWPHAPALKSQPLTGKKIAAQDAIIIITDHTTVDYQLIAKHAKLIVDSRGVYRKPLPNLVKA
ncbi:UDP-N-acetyl-D-glucosamine dehydrogenase [Smithella sp. SC_K08D17]|jgi:UDP-N-acetyl-D-glucosamine dehydrogenase|nr:UDP-N-acetyl-D-glucosamine dehydrogenase [Smithella sp. SC_K08D17]MDD5525597.1 nucleotide sugar dehydrogenase [Smithella sp.]